MRFTYCALYLPAATNLNLIVEFYFCLLKANRNNRSRNDNWFDYPPVWEGRNPPLGPQPEPLANLRFQIFISDTLIMTNPIQNVALVISSLNASGSVRLPQAVGPSMFATWRMESFDSSIQVGGMAKTLQAVQWLDT